MTTEIKLPPLPEAHLYEWAGGIYRKEDLTHPVMQADASPIFFDDQVEAYARQAVEEDRKARAVESAVLARLAARPLYAIPKELLP